MLGTQQSKFKVILQYSPKIMHVQEVAQAAERSKVVVFSRFTRHTRTFKTQEVEIPTARSRKKLKI